MEGSTLRFIAAAVSVLAVASLAGCSAAIGNAADNPPDDSLVTATTVPPSTAADADASDAPPSTKPPTSERPATTRPAIPPTTNRPTSTRPATTRPSTTTTRPTTTTTRPTTTTTMPSPADIPVDAVAQPFAAVGTSNGDETVRIQYRLLELGFWLGGADGLYGKTTLQAVMAFQKYAGLEATGSVDEATAAALGSITARARGRVDAGTMIEIDKDRQLLFVVQDSKPVWVFNTSTGDGEEYTEPDQNSPGTIITDVALTPNGLHRVNREREEGWWAGDLGEIYRPKYFVGGVAVHGSYNVPNYPASHGCVRVTIEAMDFIWASDLMPMGIPVWVHGD